VEQSEVEKRGKRAGRAYLLGARIVAPWGEKRLAYLKSRRDKGKPTVILPSVHRGKKRA